MQSRVALVLCLLLAACSGGGGGGGAIPHSAPNPGSTATAAPQGNFVAAAPAQIVTTSGLVRRKPQGGAAVSALGAGIPTAVGLYSPLIGQLLTQLYVWADNAQSVPQPESTMTASIPAPDSISAVNPDINNAFSATYHDYTVTTNIAAVGKTNTTIIFGDGTTGKIPVYTYDWFYNTCSGIATPSSPQQWAYQGGIPTGNAATPDAVVSCTSPYTLTFPNGAMKVSDPVADSYGNVASAFTTVLSVGTFTNNAQVVPVSSLVPGTIYIVKLSDGGYAKLMPWINDGAPTVPNVSGASLHDVPNGSGVFPY